MRRASLSSLSWSTTANSAGRATLIGAGRSPDSRTNVGRSSVAASARSRETVRGSMVGGSARSIPTPKDRGARTPAHDERRAALESIAVGSARSRIVRCDAATNIVHRLENERSKTRRADLVHRPPVARIDARLRYQEIPTPRGRGEANDDVGSGAVTLDDDGRREVHARAAQTHLPVGGVIVAVRSVHRHLVDPGGQS